MRIANLIETTRNMSGNYIRGVTDLYISCLNISYLCVMLDECEDIENLLITPFLLNIEEGTVYELHYYEFEIEVQDILKSRYVEYPIGNSLPAEITSNIKPKVIISKGDNEFFVETIRDYFVAMQGMSFDDERTNLDNFDKFTLCFQIY